MVFLPEDKDWYGFQAAIRAELLKTYKNSVAWTMLQEFNGSALDEIRAKHLKDFLVGKTLRDQEKIASDAAEEVVEELKAELERRYPETDIDFLFEQIIENTVDLNDEE